jgi:hypothetical protein
MTTTWVLLLFLNGSQTGAGARIAMPYQPTVIERYQSVEDCEAALAFAEKKFKTEWRAVWGGCIPGGIK